MSWQGFSRTCGLYAVLFHPLIAGCPLCLGLESLAALSNPHTHTSAVAMHAGSPGAIVTANASV